MIRVLVDLSYLAYRALYTMGDLSHDELPTGVIFGVLSQIRAACEDPRVQSNRVLIFADSKKSFRKRVFPDYKRKRNDKTPEEWKAVSIMRDQRSLLEKEILPTIGFPVYRQTGLESDDLIAWTARDLTHSLHTGPQKQAVIITADGDLFQCISEVVHWFDPGRNAYHTPASILFTRGIDAHRWGEVKSIAGCQTDNVPGVPGVGETTAIQYLLKTLPPGYKRAQAIIDNGEVIKRNRDLVVLPHRKTKPLELRDPEYRPEEFFKVCEKYGLESFVRERAGWESFFRGARFKLRKRGETRAT